MARNYFNGWREERGQGWKAELVVFKSSTLCGVGSFQFIFEFSINLDGQSKDPTNSKSQESQGFTAFYNVNKSGRTGDTYLHFHRSIIVLWATAFHSTESQRKMVEFQSSSMGTHHASQSPTKSQARSPNTKSSRSFFGFSLPIC